VLGAHFYNCSPGSQIKMANKIKTIVKLQIPAGKATPAPPVGPALGQHGLNIGEFVNKFNEATKDKGDDIIPIEITVYEDRTFDFKLKTPPVSDLLRKAVGIEKGSGKNISQKVGKITKKQLREIAERKMEDLNANDVEAAERIISGTARSMGIEVME
jgi:large subunit ribosomal protein L11